MDALPDPPCGRLTNRTRWAHESPEWMRFQIATATNRYWWLRRIKICHSAVFISTSALTNRTGSAHESSSDITCDLEAQDLYSKFYRYKQEMFNFPNHPGKFGIYQMQSYFR